MHWVNHSSWKSTFFTLSALKANFWSLSTLVQFTLGCIFSQSMHYFRVLCHPRLLAPQHYILFSLPIFPIPNSLHAHFLRRSEFYFSQCWMSHAAGRSWPSACRNQRSRLRLSMRSVLHWRRQSRSCRGKWMTSWLTWRGHMQSVQHSIKSRGILIRFVQMIMPDPNIIRYLIGQDKFWNHQSSALTVK